MNQIFWIAPKRKTSLEKFMGHTFSSEYSHIVFCTKGRYPWLKGNCREKCYDYMRGVAIKIKAMIVEIGGIEDHVHILVRRPTMMDSSVIAKHVKGASSRWFKKEFPDSLGFAWQDGFGSFSVSVSQIDKVRRYIRGQPEHHQTETYLEEFKKLLKSHQIDFEERELLD
jgi:REP element-mobilizing transposase RayT